VHPPGSEEFESTAVAWLLDVVPPDYRLHGVLRRYPVALAALARYHSKACVEGARQGYRAARTELADALPPHAIDTVLAAYRKEGARLAATARAVGLVERALRGEVFTPKMPQDGARTEQPRTEQARPRTEYPRQSARTEQPQSARTEQPQSARTEQPRPQTEQPRPRTERIRESARTEKAPPGTEQARPRAERSRQGTRTEKVPPRTEQARRGDKTRS
jgi:hypothetical protein